MNRGLQSNFELEKGAFKLTVGVEKARDAIRFLTEFDKQRVYLPDFASNFVTLLQKPASYVQANSTILLGTYSKTVEKYVDSVNITGLDIGYLQGNRRVFLLQVEYVVEVEDMTKVKDVIFV